MKKLLFIFLLFYSAAHGQIFPLVFRTPAAGGCPYLLDSYTGSTAAFSMNKIRAAYAGACIRVKETGGSTESDIGFVGTCGLLDSAALATFVGANSGYIVKWYDQSGNGNDATASGGFEPRIVNAGTIDRNSAGKISPYFNAGGVFLTIPGVHGSPVLDAYVVYESPDVQWLLFEGAGAGGNYSYVAHQGSGSTGLYQNFGTPALYANSSLITPTTRDDVYNALTGYKISTYQGADVSAWTRFTIGNYPGWDFGSSYVGELVVWTSDVSASRAGILSNQNSRWVVY